MITQKRVSELAWRMQNKSVTRKTVPSGGRKEPTSKSGSLTSTLTTAHMHLNAYKQN